MPIIWPWEPYPRPWHPPQRPIAPPAAWPWTDAEINRLRKEYADLLRHLLDREERTAARLADQVNELGEELADLREENAGLKVENQELRARLERETPARHEDRDLLEAHLALVERVRDLHRRIDIAEGEITSLIHDPDANGETRVDGIARTVDELADRIQALEGEAA